MYLFHGQTTREVKRLDTALVKATVRKLDMIAAAAAVVDLRAPPGNRLEALHGDLEGWFSIRVNDQWRLVFRWLDGAAEGVKLVDFPLGGQDVAAEPHTNPSGRDPA